MSSCNVIGTRGVDVINGGCLPFISPLWAQIASNPPKFDETKSGWRGFSREWPDFVERLASAQPGGVSDNYPLQLLVDSVGPTAQMWVRQHREAGTALNYDQF